MMNEELIVIGHNTFAINLYTELRKKELNIFFSPFSIYTALSMVYVGARGDTENLIRNVLSIPLEQNKYHDNFKNLMNHIEQGGSVLLLANLICIQQGYQLLKKFLGTIKEKYSGEIWNLDFNNSTESCSKINAWVEKNTQGKIKKIIQSINEKMGIVIINAIYFQGEWEKVFKKKATKDEDFTLLTGEKTKVKMMHLTKKFRFIEEDGFKVLEMPYKGLRIFGKLNKVSMVIFLPDKYDGLEEMENRLSYKVISNSLRTLDKLWEREVKISFPRFSFDTKYELNGLLSKMGLSSLFSDGANFSGIASDPPRSISRIIHKAYVDVDEKGTKAAAATAVAMIGATLAPPKLPEFKVDHPFLFLIIDSNTNTILFMGRVVEPDMDHNF